MIFSFGRNRFQCLAFFFVLLLCTNTFAETPPSCPTAANVHTIDLSKQKHSRVDHKPGGDWVVLTGPETTIPFINRNYFNEERKWLLIMEPFSPDYEKNQVLGIAQQMLTYAPEPFNRNAYSEQVGGTIFVCMYNFPKTPGPIYLMLMSYGE